MKQLLVRHVRALVICVSSLFLMIVISACSGVGTPTGSAGNTLTITGTIQSVSTTNHSVSVTVNGQSYTVNGLTDAEVAQLQSQVGKNYTIQATQNADGSYTIVTGTNPVAAGSNATGVTVTTTSNQQGTNSGPAAQGSIDFIGKVQSVNPSSIIVTMPNGDALTMGISTLTDRGDFGNTLPTVNQLVKVKAITNPDGTFLAKSLDAVKSDDASNPTKLNTVSFQGVTTSQVGPDNVIHFRVGTKDYSFTVNQTTALKGFTTAQSIPANQSIKLDVLYSGSNGSVLKVDNGND